jgi:hypothetical protein
MPPKKPTRASDRIAGRRQPAPDDGKLPLAESSKRSLGVPSESTGLGSMSNLSTPPVTSEEELHRLVSDAKRRVGEYLPTRGDQDCKLPDLLAACVDHLPSGGRESLARDIIECTDDSALFDVYNNIYSALILPSSLSNQSFHLANIY